MHEDAATVLEQLGGNSSDFVARQLTPRIIEAADLVLAMTTRHRDAALEYAPRQLRRTFTLSEAARLASDFDVRSVGGLADLRSRLGPDERVDIADPIGQTSDVFAKVGSQIADLLPPIVELCRRG